MAPRSRGGRGLMADNLPLMHRGRFNFHILLTGGVGEGGVGEGGGGEGDR